MPPYKTSPEMEIEYYRPIFILWSTTEAGYTIKKGRWMSLIRCNGNLSRKTGTRTTFIGTLFCLCLLFHKPSLITDSVFPRRLSGSTRLTQYWGQPPSHTAGLAFRSLHCTRALNHTRLVSRTITKQVPNNWGYYRCIELIFEYMLW